MATFAPPSNIVRRYVPNDHECLFTAIAYLCEGSRHGNCGHTGSRIRSKSRMALFERKCDMAGAAERSGRPEERTVQSPVHWKMQRANW